MSETEKKPTTGGVVVHPMDVEAGTKPAAAPTTITKVMWLAFFIALVSYFSLTWSKTTNKTLLKPLGTFFQVDAANMELPTTMLHGFPTVVLGLVAGSLCIGIGAKWNLVLCLVLAVAGQACCAFGPLMGPGGYWLFCVGRFLNGAGVGMQRAVAHVILKMWFPKDKLSTVFSLLRWGDIWAVALDSAISLVIFNAMTEDTVLNGKTVKNPTGPSLFVPSLVGTILIAIALVPSLFFPKHEHETVEREKYHGQSLLSIIGDSLKQTWHDLLNLPAVWFAMMMWFVFLDVSVTPFLSSNMAVFTDQYWFDGTNAVVAFFSKVPKYIGLAGFIFGMTLDRFGGRRIVLFAVPVALIFVQPDLSLPVGQLPGKYTPGSRTGDFLVAVLIWLIMGVAHFFATACYFPACGVLATDKRMKSAYGITTSINALLCSMVPFFVLNKLIKGLVIGHSKSGITPANNAKFIEIREYANIAFNVASILVACLIFFKYKSEFNDDVFRKKEEHETEIQQRMRRASSLEHCGDDVFVATDAIDMEGLSDEAEE
ncbi:MAG: hypothetical protein MHM6MM_003324 [Cercozoa sp. M6MM]